MHWYWSLMVFVFGAIIGSFLNVVIYRLHTGKSLNGRSHCLSCGTVLRWYELLPLVSFIALRAKCRSCASHIPFRYLVVEILTALAFLGIFQLYAADLALLFLHFFITAILILIVLYDIRHSIIPDELVLLLLGGALAAVSYTALIGEVPLTALWGHVGAGVAGGAFLAMFWLVSKGRWMGLGDAKLMVPLGILLGPWNTFAAIVLSFWTGAAISVALLVFARILRAGTTRVSFLPPALKIKSEIPFAPFLILGFSLVHFFHVDLFQAFPLIFPF